MMVWKVTHPPLASPPVYRLVTQSLHNTYTDIHSLCKFALPGRAVLDVPIATNTPWASTPLIGGMMLSPDAHCPLGCTQPFAILQMRTNAILDYWHMVIGHSCP